MAGTPPGMEPVPPSPQGTEEMTPSPEDEGGSPPAAWSAGPAAGAEDAPAAPPAAGAEAAAAPKRLRNSATLTSALINRCRTPRLRFLTCPPPVCHGPRPS